ncbi:MAG: hypothetical protein HYS27_15650 [Deltaproteobacteria bacterium]|nr:hypothetical protein [Deltaproteobacteria bacterium]
MATRDGDPTDKAKQTGSISLPALTRELAPSAPEDPTPQAIGPPEQLGFHLRFEAGRALLALENRALSPGVEIKRALFEVPDVEFPLDVSGGAQRFQSRRLTLRAIELSLSHASLYLPDQLKAGGFTLLRERSRAGGVELLVELAGPAGPVPLRARGLFAPVGEAGVALVLHEVIAFSPLPRPRLEVAAALLDALALPGALPARAMVRRADPFRAVLRQLLPAYGWKVPAVGDVRVNEVVFGKTDVTLRAWSRALPDGWKAPKEQKRGPLEEAVALAVFADGMDEAKDDVARLALVDRLIDERALAPAVVPFAAEVLRRSARRRAEGDDLIARALGNAPEHLGLLSAHAEAEELEPAERGRRLLALGKAADAADEPWVAARAFLAAAGQARLADDAALALEAAEAGFLADPSLAETGALFCSLLAERGDLSRALSVGRTALERTEEPTAAEALAVRLAGFARAAEGIDAARVLLRRALRRADRVDALGALIDVEVEAGALERAAELLTRLLMQAERPEHAAARADVELLAARIAEARGDRDTARLHLARARELRPGDAAVAVRLAQLFDDDRQLDRALEVLRDATEAPEVPAMALALFARLSVKRHGAGDAERARAALARIAPGERDRAVLRTDAEAQAMLGEPGPLAELLAAEGELLGAARLFVDAARIEDAGAALARALVDQQSGVAEALVELAARDAEPAAVVRALAAAAAPLPDAALHGPAGRLAAAGRVKDAHALLDGRGDVVSVEQRASFAEAAADVALEVEERERLAALLEAEPAARDPAAVRRAGDVHRRLGALHVRPGGRGAAAAADAWQRASEAGAVDVAAWLDAALHSGDAARLARVLRREDAEVHAVPSGPLRDAVRAATAAGDAVGDAGARLRLSGVLAARAERLSDVEDYLGAARALPPRQAAAVLGDAALRHGRADWLLEAADILANTDERGRALALLLDAPPAGVGGAVEVQRRAFGLAQQLGDAPALEKSAAALFARADLPREERLAVHAAKAAALGLVDRTAALAALGAWLDDDAGAEAALTTLVGALLDDARFEPALDRLQRAVEAGGPATDARRALLARAADAAQKQGEVAFEIRARELMLGDRAPQDARFTADLERLADLYAEAGRFRSAVDVLERRVLAGGSDETLAALLLRIAALEEDQLGDKPRAAAALRGHLRHAPDDASASRRLQGLLHDSKDDAGLHEECMRRAARLRPGAERTELLLRAGDAALRAGLHAEARDAWMTALASTPWSVEALDKLLTLARADKNHRLVVRARLVAAQTLADGPAAAEQAAEAGAYLYSFLGRPRLALSCFRWAESRDKKPQRHTRLIVDLHRALGEGGAALAAIDQLLDKAKDKEKPLLLESRAEVLEELLGEHAAAADARRQALALDPKQRTAARLLARQLRQAGDVRGALAVERAFAEAALSGRAKAAVYAQLAVAAEEELKDAALCAELCAAALKLDGAVDVLRRYARVLEAAGDNAEAVDALKRLAEANLALDERLDVLVKKARLEEHGLGNKKEARRTLRAALADAELAAHPGADVLVDGLSRLEEELDDPAAAAALLQDALAEHPEGTKALGDRPRLLERVAGLLDAGAEAGRDPGRALDLLEEAAQLADLSRASELRRARLAEGLGRHAVAAVALERLLALSPDAEERLALLGRLALAAERADRIELALSSWAERAERLPGDIDTLRAVERLAGRLGRAAEARAAADALVRIEAGADDERALRLLFCARDSRDRLADAKSGAWLFSRALALRTDASLRREALACAEAARDAGAALALLVQMEEQGDELSAEDLARRAELRIETSGASRAALDDVVTALDRGAAADVRTVDLLARAASGAPDAAARALLARLPAGGAAADALRQVMVGERLADRSIDLDVVLAIADALPADLAATTAAATALLDHDSAAGRMLDRLERLRPVLAGRADLRARALLVLRDQEAWAAVADVLGDAVEAAAPAERRALRLELVSVLRTGLEDDARAVPHLQLLVDEDPDDREAWGELLESLDALGDTGALAEALGRRAARAAGLERRELVRRRSLLLVELGRGVEALPLLTQVRREHGGDVELKDIERRIHEAQGAVVLGAHLAAELERAQAGDGPTADAAAADAERLLALDVEAVDPAARVLAHLRLADSPAAARVRAAEVLEAPASVERRVTEAVTVAERLPDELRPAFLEGLARQLGALGSADALCLSDALFARAVPGTAAAFGVAAVQRRWRTAGPRRAQADVDRLRAQATTPQELRAAAAVELRLALRLHDAPAIAECMTALDGRSGEALANAWAARADGSAREALEGRAARAVLAAASGAAAVVAAVRTGDAARGQRLLSRAGSGELRRAAQRARRLRLTPERLSLRLALAEALPDADSVLELREAARVALAVARPDDAARALDGLLARGAGDAATLSARADVAWDRGEANAAARAAAAADALAALNPPGGGAEALRHRRRAVEALVRRGDAAPLAQALLAFARAAPDDAAVQTEALGLAEASGCADIVDTLMAEAAERSAGAEARGEAVRRRASHRLHALKDAKGAFEVLRDGAAGGDARLKDEAYRLAVSEGLVEEQLEVVDDPLAKAGLLALLGKSAAALAAAEALEEPAAALLAAEVAALEGDVGREAAALERLFAGGAADAASLALLVGLDRRRGRLDEAAARAADLIDRFGASPERVALLIEIAGGGAAAAKVAPALRGLLEAGVVPSPLVERAVDVWEAAAHLAALPEDVRAARLRRCRALDRDELWLQFLEAELPAAPVEEVARWLKPLLARGTILRRLAGDGEGTRGGDAGTVAGARLAEAVARLVQGGDAAAVVEALTALERAAPLPWALRRELAGALAVLGRPRDAAAVLLGGAPPADGAARAELAVSAARFSLDAGDVPLACDALLRLPLAFFDDASIAFASEAARRAGGAGVGGAGAALAVRLAVAAADEGMIDQALALAAAAPPAMARAVAAWRLRSAPLDERAWRLAAQGGGAAQQHFAGALALRGVGPWPADAADDVARARRLRERTLSAGTLLAWHAAARRTTPLARARAGAPEDRAVAWRELASTVAAATGEAAAITAARLLSRAGVPMSEAPIEVRLAVDPALSAPAARAAALADALASAELSREPGRRDALVASFDALDAQGFAGARLRQDVHGGRPGITGHVDAADLGAGVDVAALVRLFGRRPSPALRTTAAALLASQGEEALARALDPRLFAAAPPSASAALLRSAAARAADARERAGLLRQAAAIGGYDAELEREIQEAAEAAALPLVVCESLGRMAGAAEEPAVRAGFLRERALVRVGFTELTALACRDAAAAHDLQPKAVDTARLWLQVAELHGAPRDIAAALGAVARTEDDPRAHADASARRVELLAGELHDAEGALAAVEEALGRAPNDAALLRAKARALEAMGDRAAAVGALCLAARAGDAEALDAAEPLARELASPRLLDEVLAARLLSPMQGRLDPVRRREVALERAVLQAEQLGDRPAALALLEQQALADDADAAARRQLALWYAADRRFLDAALAWESAAAVADLPPVERGPAAREAACLLASLGDLERAGPLAEVAVGCGVVDHKVLAVAGAWHRAHNRWDVVDRLLESEIALEPDVQRQAGVWLERAHLRRQQLDDAAGAKRALHRVLDLDPCNAGALAVMRADAEHDRSYGALRAALFRAAESTADRRTQRRLLLEIATLDLDRFDDARAAEATLAKALELDADAADALVLKARLLVKGGHVEGVAALIERAEQAGARELPGILQLVRGEGLLLSGERDAAMAALKKAAADPETADKAWDLLVDMHEGTPELLPTLVEARGAAQDDKRRLALLRREARARQKAGADDALVTIAEQILALDAGDTDAFKVVREAYTKKRKPQLVQPAMSAWARAASGQEHARRLGQLGCFLLDEVGDEAQAREAFEEALSADANEATSLVRLADIAWAARDDERALDLLDRIGPDQWQRTPVDLAYRRARCAFALGRDDAHDRLRAVLRLDAKHQDALEMMVRSSLQRHDDEGAEFALEALTAAIPPREDPVRLAQACLELTTLRGRQGRFGDALVAAERAFDLDPTNVVVLEAVAEARGAAGRHAEAAEAWRRASAARTGQARASALEKRATHLARAGRTADAVELLLDLKRETGTARYKSEAEELARASGDAQLMRKLHLAPGAVSMPEGAPVASSPPEITRTESQAADSDRAMQAGFNALHMQVRANLEENDPKTALRIVEQALQAGGADPKLLSMGLEAAERLGTPQRLVELLEARLKAASEPAEVKELARIGARLCRDRLADPDRAAGLLYLAHQADAEDLDIRFELTELYALIPRLVGHAVTGVLQLLRRTPADPRVFELAGALAEAQGQTERAANLRSVAHTLQGKGVAYDPRAMVLDERPTIRPFDDETIRSRLAPTGWGGPLHDLLVLVGPALASAFHDGVLPPGARPLHEVSSRGALALDRVERILPGRPFRLQAAAVDRLVVVPGVVATAIIPLDAVQLGDAALLALVARAYGLVRLGAIAGAVIPEGQEGAAAELLRGALLGGATDARAQKLRLQLREEERQAAERLVEPALKGDVASALRVLVRGADRFALMASGNVIATLHASSLPGLLREAPQKAAAMLQTSPVALELCAFAARDNTWLVRRQHGLSST